MHIVNVLLVGASLSSIACHSTSRPSWTDRPTERPVSIERRRSIDAVGGVLPTRPMSIDETSVQGSTPVSVYGGAGFTSGPSSFRFGGGADVHLARHWSVGPQVHLGVSDKRSILTAACNFKRFFPIETSDGLVLHPFSQAGIGLAYLDEDRPGSDDDEVGLLLNVGGGVRHPLTDEVSIGSSLLVNVLPGEVVDERVFFSWEIVQLVFSF